jgi:predicted metal-dependent hydrolase
VPKLLSQARETPRQFVERRVTISGDVAICYASVRIGHRKITLSVSGSTIAKREAVMHSWHKSLLHDAVPPLIRKWGAKLEVKVAAYFLQRMKTKRGVAITRPGTFA